MRWDDIYIYIYIIYLYRPIRIGKVHVYWTHIYSYAKCVVCEPGKKRTPIHIHILTSYIVNIRIPHTWTWYPPSGFIYVTAYNRRWSYTVRVLEFLWKIQSPRVIIIDRYLEFRANNIEYITVDTDFWLPNIVSNRHAETHNIVVVLDIVATWWQIIIDTH